MARIKRKQIKFTEESLNEVYQEIYNDSHNFKAQVMAILSVWGPMVKDEGNVAAMGKEIVNLMNSIARTNDQKIALLKILKDIVFDKKAAGEAEASRNSSNGDQVTLGDDSKNTIMAMIEEAKKAMEKNQANNTTE